MGASTHVVGFKTPDEKFKKMLAVHDACTSAGIEVPDEVSTFFNDERPDPAGVTIHMDKVHGVRRWTDNDMCEGYEIDLRAIPPDIQVIRVYTSY
jgi:hypothetical protein